MLKKILVSLLVCLGLSTGAYAGELKSDMDMLVGSVTSLQMGFFTNDKAATLAAVETLREHVRKILGDKKTITKLLPDDVKHKASIAINSAHMIEKYAGEIEKTLKDRSLRMINQQMRSQKAFLGIQNQCFRCHNLVRDWK
ncbi:hypothetical protein [Sulfurimonas sp.]